MRVLSDIVKDEVIAIGVEELSRMVADPDGPFPACKPALGTTRCLRCGRDVINRRDACPAIPRNQRWNTKP